MEILIVIYWISVAICLFGLLKRGKGLCDPMMAILLSFFPPVNIYLAFETIRDLFKKPEKIRIFREDIGKIREFIRTNQADSAKHLFDILQCPSNDFEREYEIAKSEVNNALTKLTGEKSKIQEEEKRKREIKDQEQRSQPGVSVKDTIPESVTSEIIGEKSNDIPKTKSLRQILWQYNEETIIPKHPDRANGILRQEMLDQFVKTKPLTRREFVEGFPNAWRQKTDGQQIEYLEEIFDIIDDYISENPNDQKEIYPDKEYDDVDVFSKEEWKYDLSSGSKVKVIIHEYSREYGSGAYSFTKNLLGIKLYSDENNKLHRMEKWEEYWCGDDFNKNKLNEIVDWLNSMEDNLKKLDDTTEFVEEFDRVVHHLE